MKKRNQTWYGVLDASRNTLIRITADFGKATSTNSVSKGSTIQHCQAKNAKQAIRTVCADVLAKASEGCYMEHEIGYGN